MKKKSPYQTTTGRRKTAVVRLRFKQGTGQILCNGKSLEVYFMRKSLIFKINRPFEVTGEQARFDMIVRVDGGGLSAQAEALSLAISRALLQSKINLRPLLRKNGLLTRDSRKTQRKMYGHKKARKSFQFSKR